MYVIYASCMHIEPLCQNNTHTYTHNLIKSSMLGLFLCGSFCFCCFVFFIPFSIVASHQCINAFYRNLCIRRMVSAYNLFFAMFLFLFLRFFCLIPTRHVDEIKWRHNDEDNDDNDGNTNNFNINH